MKRISVLSAFLFLSAIRLAGAANETGPHREVFIETLEVHHAHIENEVRVNGAFRENVRSEEVDDAGETAATYRDVLEHTFELGWGSQDKRIGVEAHVPFTNEGRNSEGESVFGLGDIEVEPIRYAFVNRPETVWTASLGIVLPTGDEEQSSGEGRTFIEPHLLADHTWGNWYFGANLIPGIELGGENEKTLGWGLATAYTWEGLLNGSDLAASLELAGESSLSGEPEGLDTAALVPGIHFHFPNGWRARLGLKLPLTEDREEERAFLFQAGTHWGHE